MESPPVASEGVWEQLRDGATQEASRAESESCCGASAGLQDWGHTGFAPRAKAAAVKDSSSGTRPSAHHSAYTGPLADQMGRHDPLNRSWSIHMAWYERHNLVSKAHLH